MFDRNTCIKSYKYQFHFSSSDFLKKSSTILGFVFFMYSKKSVAFFAYSRTFLVFILSKIAYKNMRIIMYIFTLIVFDTGTWATINLPALINHPRYVFKNSFETFNLSYFKWSFKLEGYPFVHKDA